ncbi:hypothetical protein A5N86_10660 [Geobacillus thermoleovorans]|uniref:Uncharacterized protein n=1 Tax=Geobacillus thermoleovorans TaxID=33941 RepID=A0A2Z3N6F4_GEOTH|nr:hypothetical protein C1N76_07900 [Geobacillus thermoleovorans]EQB97520.1 hypothetical protein GA8_00475 [Geobacillus sp. A8]KDE50676.1 hypothetical protein DI44_02845 [Geobacillus sp. CAMR5420]ODA17019.1 hypothetical protein A5N86_10660 [Geobacillus thermoleovorans]OQP08201.1 hypothetical protein B1692_18075 [Geobacillus thermoleovorans]
MTPCLSLRQKQKVGTATAKTDRAKTGDKILLNNFIDSFINSPSLLSANPALRMPHDAQWDDLCGVFIELLTLPLSVYLFQ